MQTLKEAIAVFQQEISAALAGAQGSIHGLNWQAERVTLTLEVASDASAAGANGATPVLRVRPAGRIAAKGACGHTVSIEFRVSRPGVDADDEDSPESTALVRAPVDRRTVAPASKGSEVDRVARELSAIFGPPGFDSSARAAVFCEVLHGLAPAQALAICEALTVSVKDVQDEDVRRARHALLGVIRSGPLKSPGRAVEILTDLFRRCPIPTMIKLVEEQWKTEGDWHR